MKPPVICLLLLGLLACAPASAPPQSGTLNAAIAETQAAPDLALRLNTLRAAQDLPPLTEDPAMTRAAIAHAADMAAKGYFSHTAPDGSTPLRRMRSAGFNACFAAENIAKGQRSAEAVIQSWAASDAHRRNMLSLSPKAVGVARGPQNIWVMTLARAC